MESANIDRIESRLKWIEHQGKKVLRIDYRGLKTPAQTVELLHKSGNEITSSKTPVLLLVNYTGVPQSYEYMKSAEKFRDEFSPGLVTKTAVVGVVSLVDFLLRLLILFQGNIPYRSFRTEQAALDWLVA